MRWVALFCAVMLATVVHFHAANAGTVVKYDNEHNKILVDEETAATPGAGSGLGAVVGAVSDTLLGYEKHRIDLMVALNAFGVAGDDSAGTEGFNTAATIFYRPNAWMRAGPQFSWNTADRTYMDLSLPFGFKIAPNPFSTFIWWINLDVLPHFTARFSEGDVPRKSAWTWAPAASLSAQIPMGQMALEAGIGVGYPFSIQGVTDQAENAAVEQLAGQLGVSGVWRF